MDKNAPVYYRLWSRQAVGALGAALDADFHLYRHAGGVAAVCFGIEATLCDI
jgi:hypothetical protein